MAPPEEIESDGVIIPLRDTTLTRKLALKMASNLNFKSDATDVKYSFTINELNVNKFSAPIMDPNIIRAVIKCIQTGEAYTLRTGKLLLEAHPILVRSGGDDAPTLTFGPVNIGLGSPESRRTALSLLTIITETNFEALRRCNSSYVKNDYKEEATFHLGGTWDKEISLVRTSGGLTHSITISRSNLREFIDGMRDVSVQGYGWYNDGTCGGIGQGNDDSQSWTTCCTGRQGQFALSVNTEGDKESMRSMIINAEDIPNLIATWKGTGFDSTSSLSIDMERVKNNAKYDWAVKPATGVTGVTAAVVSPAASVPVESDKATLSIVSQAVEAANLARLATLLKALKEFNI